MSTQMSVNVHIAQNNAVHVDAAEITIDTRQSIAQLKKLCAETLSVRCERLFFANGAELTDLSELNEGDMLHASAGEPFYRNAGAGSEKMEIAVVGSGGVGKTAVTLRFVRDMFVAEWDPTIEDTFCKAFEVDGGHCMLDVLDTAGQDEFESLRSAWLTGRDGFVFVFALNDAASLRALDAFFSTYEQINGSRRPQPPIVLVGNKSDIVNRHIGSCSSATASASTSALASVHHVAETEARKVAERFGAIYLECSALTGEGVHEVFEHVVRGARRRALRTDDSDISESDLRLSSEGRASGSISGRRRKKRGWCFLL